MAYKKRSNGEGCFYQLKDRSWVLQITFGRKEDGSLARKSFKGKTKTACIERKDQWIAEQRALQQVVDAQYAEEQETMGPQLSEGHSEESDVLF